MSYRSHRMLSIPAILALTVIATCSRPAVDESETGLETPPVYVAFSGGGWHTHTAMAAWLGGLLDLSPNDNLSTALQHVDAIAANSGGSWFLTQMAFSEKFAGQLETKAGRDAWLTDGYIGQTKKLFHFKEPCEGWHERIAREICENVPYLQPYFALLGASGWDTLNWTRFVKKVVYEPWQMNQKLENVRLDHPRNKWSDGTHNWSGGKDLIFASSLLTDQVVLSESYEYNQLYKVTSRPSGKNFTPLFFSSMGSGLEAPALFGQGEVEVRYHSSSLFSGHANRSYSSTHPANVPVMDAAIASSAAPGAVASETALSQAGYSLIASEAAYYAADLAPPIRVQPEGISFPATLGTGKDYEGLAKEGSLRVADGGYLDNTAVAYLMQYLDDNGLLVDGFRIVSFMNSTSPGVTMGKQTIPESAADLFGHARYDGGHLVFCDARFCVRTLSTQVFDPAPWGKVNAPTWQYVEGDVSLRYYQLAVTTVGNSTFNIPPNKTGTLHLFISEDFKSSALPTSEAVMNSYDDVYNVTRAGVAQQGGGNFLARALAF